MNVGSGKTLTLGGNLTGSGTINSVTIGQSLAAAGSFTTLSASSNVTFSGAVVLSSTLTANGNTTLGDATTDTITLTANPTLSAGTNNGVLYLNGSKVATSGSALTFDGNSFVAQGGAVYQANFQQTAANAYGEIRVTGNARGGQIEFMNGSTRLSGIYGDTNNSLIFVNGTGDSEQMRLTSTGLGIGLGGSSPTSRLQIVASNSSDANNTLTGSWVNIGTSLTAGFAMRQKGNSAGISGITYPFQMATLGNLAIEIYTADSQPLVFGTNATERARITSGGNFFIGNGETAASPSAGILSATGGTGENIAGANLTIRGGASTGTGAGGVIIFSTAAASGTSGTATNSASERVRIGSGGEVYFPGVGTTASAANAYLNNGSTPANQLLRSTSSLRYKTDVETLDHAKADAVLNLRPVWYRSKAEADRKDWSWYGLIAEEVAQVEPRLVHWSYPEDQFETIETQTEIEKTREVEVTPAVLDDEDNVVEPAVTETETYTETETKSERKLKTDAQLAPDGVQYDRLTVMLLDIVKRQNQRIEQLEAKVAALEAQ
jgi:hypothetical protein